MAPLFYETELLWLLSLKEIEWANRRERERLRKFNRAKLMRKLRKKMGNKKATFRIIKLGKVGPVAVE